MFYYYFVCLDFCCWSFVVSLVNFSQPHVVKMTFFFVLIIVVLVVVLFVVVFILLLLLSFLLLYHHFGGKTCFDQNASKKLCDKIKDILPTTMLTTIIMRMVMMMMTTTTATLPSALLSPSIKMKNVRNAEEKTNTTFYNKIG